MARITVEDCLQKVNNRFTVIHMAAKRVRQLRKGDEPTLASKNKDIVVALREIASGNILIAENAPQGPLLESPNDIFADDIMNELIEPPKEEDKPAEEVEADSNS